MLEVPHHQPLKFFHSCHMHSPQKHLETNISSITIICGMTYSKHLSPSPPSPAFFSLVFLVLVLLLLRKNNVIFLHCNRNTRPNKIEADDSNCTVIYCIFISGLVSFPLWVQKKKNENWPQIFIFHFSEKIKIWHRFSFFIFLCSEKNKNCT